MACLLFERKRKVDIRGWALQGAYCDLRYLSEMGHELFLDVSD